MNRTIFSIAMLFITGTAFSQFNPSSGTGLNLSSISGGDPFKNVGIDRDDPDINRRLHVYRAIDLSTLGFPVTTEDKTLAMRLEGDFSNVWQVGNVSSIWDNMVDYRGFHFFDKNALAIRFSILNDNGFTGINTTQPQGRLDVNSGQTDYHDALFVGAHMSIPNQGGIIHHQKADYAWQEVAQQTGYADAGRLRFHYTNRTSPGEHLQSDVLVLHSSGKVGVMTGDPQYTLDVAGTIRSCEVKVDLNGGWCDYVFDKDYELRKLEEVEKFIEQNHHLPEVPSEDEVLQNGVNLGDMDAILLKKVEELTLYIIEQNKRINELESLLKE